MSELVKYQSTDGREIELTPQKVIEEIVPAKYKPYLTQQNVDMIIATVASLRMNPLAGDCHIGFFKGRPTIMPSINYYQRIASMQDSYDGMDSGVVVQAQDGSIVRRSGCIVPSGCVLIGGWCTAYDKNHSHPIDIEVPIEEYDQHNTMWDSKPATMIRKVAKAQALRELYPGNFANTYIAEEMPQEDQGVSVSYEVEEPDIPDFGTTEQVEMESN